jgi:hypothetical protein
LLAPRAEARLWESIAQTEARYGRALQKFPDGSRGDEQRKYRFREFYVLVTFVRGRSEEEMYFHADGKTPFSERDIQLFLDINSGGKRWQKSREVPVWTLGGGRPESWSALAAYYPKGRAAVPGLGIVSAARAKKQGLIP